MSDNRFESLALGCLGIVALIAILTVVVALLITVVWGWVVPDVFAGAVEQGLLPASITIWQALKLSILLSILGLSGSASSSSSKK